MRTDRANREHKRLIVKGDTCEHEDRRLLYEVVRHTDLGGCVWATGPSRPPGPSPSWPQPG